MDPIWICLLIVAIFLLFVLIVFNGLVKKRNQVKQSRSSIDVYLNQRFDLIPNLVETVKAYAAHEKSIFEEVAKLRSAYMENKSLSTATELDKAVNNLIAVAENYPELKASENFLNLQKNLTKMEDQLKAARRLYNTDVTTYNTSLETFPSNIIAGFFGFKPEELFQIEPGKEQNVKIDL